MNAPTIAWDNQDEDQRRATLAQAKRTRKHPHPAWAAMRELAAPIIRAFESDLFVHDRSALMRCAVDAPFLWAVGSTGTQLAWLIRPISGRMAREYVLWLEQERSSMHAWDGVSLVAVTPERAVELLTGT